MPVQPQSKLSDRIEDDRTAGTRGTTPQADLGSRYAGASYHAQDPAKLIREQQITKDTSTLNKLKEPTKQSWGQALLGSLQGGLAGYTHQLPELMNLRDRTAQRQFQEKEDLSNRIQQNVSGLSQEEMQEQGLTARTKMMADALSGRMALGQQQIQGRQEVADTRVAGQKEVAGIRSDTQEEIAQKNLTERASESQARIQMQRDIAATRAGVQREIAAARIGAAGQKIAPQILKQGQTAMTILPQLDKLENQTYQVQSQLGPLAGRWNELWTTDIGAANPAFANYRSQMTFLESAVTLAHSQGRVSNLVFEQFQRMFNAGKQSPENMVEAIHATRDWMTQYADAIKPGGVLQSGGGNALTGNSSPQATHKIVNGKIVPIGVKPNAP